MWKVCLPRGGVFSDLLVPFSCKKKWRWSSWPIKSFHFGLDSYYGDWVNPARSGWGVWERRIIGLQRGWYWQRYRTILHRPGIYLHDGFQSSFVILWIPQKLRGSAELSSVKIYSYVKGCLSSVVTIYSTRSGWEVREQQILSFKQVDIDIDI